MSIDRSCVARQLMPGDHVQPRDLVVLVPQTSLLHQLVGTCPLLIVADAPEQPIIYASPAFLDLTGYSWPELAARDWRVLLATPTNQSGPRLIGTNFGEPDVHGTVRAKHKNGRMLWLNLRMAAQRDKCGLVTHHILIFHDVTAEHRRREALEYRAHYDSLTGIANRHLLGDRFQRTAAYARRHQSSFALVLIDLDGFKLINDRFGHVAGDEILCCVAHRLSKAVRGEDTVARLGGDEFCLLLGQEPGHECIHNALSRITASLMQPVQCGAEQVSLSCSVGSSQYPDDGDSLEELLKSADVGLYAMKTLRGAAIDAH